MTGEIVTANFKEEVDLEKLLAECGEGYKLVVRRMEPEWCDGHLETIEIDPREPFNLDQLRRRYGGRKLAFKILKANGDYVANRTVKFPDPPKKDGRVLYEATGTTEPEQAKGNSNTDQLQALFQIMMQGQRENAAAITNMLTNRVAQLETALQAATDRALGVPPQIPGAGIATQQSAFDGIKESIKTIQEIEKFKEALGVAAQKEPSVMESGIEKLMEFMLKREEQKMQVAMSQQAIAASPPALPPASCYTPQAAQAPQGGNGDSRIAVLNSLGDMELAGYVKARLERMDEAQRLNIISQVADVDFIDEDDDQQTSGQDVSNGENMESGLPSVELTDEDAARLAVGNNATQGSPKPSV